VVPQALEEAMLEVAMLVVTMEPIMEAITVGLTLMAAGSLVDECLACSSPA
jgi:hypothetical protein